MPELILHLLFFAFGRHKAKPKPPRPLEARLATRVIVLLAVVPTGVVAALGVVLADESAPGWLLWLGVGLAGGVVLVAAFIARLVRQPLAAAEGPDVQAEIAETVRRAAACLTLGGLGVTAPIFWPAAVVLAALALRLMDQHRVSGLKRFGAEALFAAALLGLSAVETLVAAGVLGLAVLAAGRV